MSWAQRSQFITMPLHGCASIAKHPTSPFLLSNLEYSLCCWHVQELDEWPYPIPPDNANDEQLSILGWDQAVQGCFSCHWSLANASYSRTTLHWHNTTQAQNQWATCLVTYLWLYCVLADWWIYCNEFLYGKTSGQKDAWDSLDHVVRHLHSKDQDQEVWPVGKCLLRQCLLPTVVWDRLCIRNVSGLRVLKPSIKRG